MTCVEGLTVCTIRALLLLQVYLLELVVCLASCIFSLHLRYTFSANWLLGQTSVSCDRLGLHV